MKGWSLGRRLSWSSVLPRSKRKRRESSSGRSQPSPALPSSTLPLLLPLPYSLRDASNPQEFSSSATLGRYPGLSQQGRRLPPSTSDSCSFLSFLLLFPLQPQQTFSEILYEQFKGGDDLFLYVYTSSFKSRSSNLLFSWFSTAGFGFSVELIPNSFLFRTSSSHRLLLSPPSIQLVNNLHHDGIYYFYSLVGSAPFSTRTLLGSRPLDCSLLLPSSSRRRAHRLSLPFINPRTNRPPLRIRHSTYFLPNPPRACHLALPPDARPQNPTLPNLHQSPHPPPLRPRCPLQQDL